MKKSELKAKIEKESRIAKEKNDKFWAEMKKKPRTYKFTSCKSLKYSIGGIDPDGAHQVCWHCSECGRSGVNTHKESIRKIDKFIEEKCNLED